MKLAHVLLLLLWVLPSSDRSAAAQTRESTTTCATLDINGVGSAELARIQSQLTTWLELDDVLFACDTQTSFRPFAKRIKDRWRDVDPGALYLVRAPHPTFRLLPTGLRILAQRGPYRVVNTDDPRTAQALLAAEGPHPHTFGRNELQIVPVLHSQQLLRQTANKSLLRGVTQFNADAVLAVDAIDPERWFAALNTLSEWNRYTFGSEIAQASDWLVAQFAALGLPVETPGFSVGGTMANNVIATWEGLTEPDRWIIVGAHYDSISESPFVAAPGAEDNASGCAGVLELARIMVPLRPKATIIFVCYSGEEQGLFGSENHAETLVAAGDDAKLIEVQTMDMIGYSGDADLDVLLETSADFQAALSMYEDAATAFTSLRTVVSLNPFGSDHVPYLDRDLPALLTIENDWDSYPGYHTTTDISRNISLAMGSAILRMNVAVLAQRAGTLAGETILLADFGN